MLTILLALIDCRYKINFSWLYLATFWLDCAIIETIGEIIKNRR